MNNDVSHGLDAVKKIYEKLGSPIPWDLVVGVLNIERTCQFHEDRQLSLDQVRQLVNDFVQKELAE